jgi:hypothetical protein
VNEERATTTKNRGAISRLVILLCAALAAGRADAQVPSFIFTTHAGGTNSSGGSGLAVDSAGNAFVTGHFVGTAAFGTTNLTSAGQGDMFAAKYDTTGTLLWVAQAGGTNFANGSGIAADGTGNCYVTGAFSGVAWFGPTEVVGSLAFANSDIFVAKYDASGNLLWVRHAGGGQDGGSGIAVDPNGNSYVTGGLSYNATFGNVTLGGYDSRTIIFLVKYDTAGNVLWGIELGRGVFSDYGKAVALDSQGNVWVAGFVGQTLNQSSLELEKFDSTGRDQGVGVTAEGQSEGLGIACDAADNLFVTGNFWGTVSFVGPWVAPNQVVTLWSHGIEDAFLAKVSSDGNVLWVRQLGGTSGHASGVGVATDSSGSCFVSGEFTGTLTTTLTNLVAVGPQDGFLAKYDTAGKLIWILQLGGTGYNYPGEVSSSAGWGAYVTGAVSSGTRFGNIPLETYGPDDVFLSRIDEMPILSVMSTANNVLISWPTNQLGFTLEKATNPLPASQWSAVTNAVSVSGDRYVVTDALSGNSSFYRLTKP